MSHTSLCLTPTQLARLQAAGWTSDIGRPLEEWLVCRAEAFRVLTGLHSKAISEIARLKTPPSVADALNGSQDSTWDVRRVEVNDMPDPGLQLAAAHAWALLAAHAARMVMEELGRDLSAEDPEVTP